MVHALDVWDLARQDLFAMESLTCPTSPRHESGHDDGRGLQLEGDQVQLLNLEIVRCYWIISILFVGEGSTIRSPVLAHSHRKLVAGHVSRRAVEQAPHGQSRPAIDINVVRRRQICSECADGQQVCAVVVDEPHRPPRR